MFESKFEYTESLINKINSSSIKKYNLISEVAMFLILLGAVMLFILGNVVVGVIFSAIFALLLVNLFFTNKSISSSNRILVGQQVNIVFDKSNMVMITKLGNKILYRATFEYNTIKKIVERQDLIFLYFDKMSVVVIPKTSFKTNDDYQKALELMGNNYVI